ncbi:leucine-rich repeat-containing protein 23-like [Pseudomyrmex gracilis]|uniref:leucine-rich repeat-containing protein 23-like n=1 Tax=Pseudomyrmex gracilis TaxID=219809 RepID=UPI000994EC21|nr:leucine-rich repeat-containing protein 23-like [Pseudomyrmex gracilis]
MKKLADVETYKAEKKFGKENQCDLNESESWIESRALTHAEAGECLNTLGKCVESYEHAYLSLDASNRNLTDVSVISFFEHVRYVNVSGNRLTSEALRALETMPYLQILQANRNLLITVDLKPMPYLQQLILNKNRVTDTSGIRHKQLERLELNYNDLRFVTLDPETLVNLKILELRGNALDSTIGICCSGLAHLFLAENQIKRIEDLEVLVNLKMLHLRSNELASLDGFTEKCLSLNYVNLRNNKLTKISELRKLSCLPSLEILIVLENPFLEKDKEKEKIDKDHISDRERDKAKDLLKKMTKNGFEDFDLQN